MDLHRVAAIGELTSDHLSDKLQSEKFLRQVALEIADVVLIVVNELSFSEQEYLRHVTLKRGSLSAGDILQGQEAARAVWGTIAVVHNWKHTSEVDFARRKVGVLQQDAPASVELFAAGL